MSTNAYVSVQTHTHPYLQNLKKLVSHPARKFAPSTGGVKYGGRRGRVKKSKYKVRVAVRSLPPFGGYLGFKKEDPKDVPNCGFIIEVYAYPQILIFQCNISPVRVVLSESTLYLLILYESSSSNCCVVTVFCIIHRFLDRPILSLMEVPMWVHGTMRILRL